jgi:hypothetical protein
MSSSRGSVWMHVLEMHARIDACLRGRNKTSGQYVRCQSCGLVPKDQGLVVKTSRGPPRAKHGKGDDSPFRAKCRGNPPPNQNSAQFSLSFASKLQTKNTKETQQTGTIIRAIWTGFTAAKWSRFRKCACCARRVSAVHRVVCRAPLPVWRNSRQAGKDNSSHLPNATAPNSFPCIWRFVVFECGRP